MMFPEGRVLFLIAIHFLQLSATKMKVPPQIFHETLTRNKLVFHERNLITKLDCMDILFLSRKFKTPSNFLL